jgi:putative sterol carrier protein
MADTAREFFSTLGTRIDPSRLEGVTHSYRFDVGDAEKWHVAVDDGRIAVTEGELPADTVLRMKEEVFLKLLRGEQNPATAFMLGRIKVDGDMGGALKLKELFF